MNETLKNKLISAVTQYDEKELKRSIKNPRAHYNPYALNQYLARVNDIEDDVDAGADPAKAITAGFSGRLRNAVLKAAGFEKNETENGSWTYQPVARKESKKEKPGNFYDDLGHECTDYDGDGY